jgi:DMSO/TMAO reductase YedYZ molybdopterin-dependent catalytic subunit
VVTSVTGYRRTFPVSDANALWLVVACQGGPLTAATGAPVRLVTPGRRGFWWVKWVARVELSDAPDWRQLPFPSQ